MFRFLIPTAFLFFIIVPIALWAAYKRNKRKVFSFSNADMLFALKKPKATVEKCSWFLKIAALILFVFACARPVQTRDVSLFTQQASLDLLFTIDISSSMNETATANTSDKSGLARIEYAKQALYALLDITERERAGLVVFAQNPYTVLPLSFDHTPLRYYASRLQDYPGTIEDGTAVWDSLMVSAERLGTVDSPAKVIILITDGANNCGFFTEDQVLERLLRDDIRLYVVHVGNYFSFTLTTRGEIDKIRKVSERSSGVFFTFSEERNIQKIAKQIESLERSIEEKQERLRYHQDYYLYLLVPALVFLSVSLNLDWIYRKGYLL